MDTASQLSERTKSLIAVVAGAVIYGLLGWGMIPVLLVYNPERPQSGLLVIVLAGIGGFVGWLTYYLWDKKDHLRPAIVGFFILNSLSFMAVFSIGLQTID